LVSNPFDQFSVELGKAIASGIRNEIASKNEQKDHQFEHMDNVTKFYLDTLFSGEL
jgi:glucose-6-phosphate isomerase